MKRILFLLLAAHAHLTAADAPLRQASEARIWLKVPGNQPPLKDLRVSTGQIGTAHWEKDPEQQRRLSDITFPVRWWKWTPVTVTFTPAESGTVELTLSGTWAAAANNSVFRQEMLWDKLDAKGATLRNGGFEETEPKQPAAWNSPWGPYPAPDSWPFKNAEALEGKKVGASWHDRPLVQSLQVSAGTTVSLTFHAKAATLPDFITPKRLPSSTPAHHACARLKRGVNLGNGWEVPPGQAWNVRFTTEDIEQIAKEGFDHIRIPVCWHHHMTRSDGGWTLSRKLLDELEPVVRRALDRNLVVMLDWHHFDEFSKNPAGEIERFTGGWQAIASHFKSWPPGLFFELLNEPCDQLSTEALAPVYQKTVDAIRKVDAKRIIVASPGQWGQVSELERLRLPDDDRIIVTVHCYEPFQFTHQGAGWVGLQDLKGIRFPGPPSSPFAVPPSLQGNQGVVAFVEGYNQLPTATNPSSIHPVRQTLREAREWSDYFGRPVHLGEFGAHQTADDPSRGNYLREVRITAEQLRIPWALWEWKAGFGYWDPQAGKARFHQALFE
jgi:endoglucanase